MDGSDNPAPTITILEVMWIIDTFTVDETAKSTTPQQRQRSGCSANGGACFTRNGSALMRMLKASLISTHPASQHNWDNKNWSRVACECVARTDLGSWVQPTPRAPKNSFTPHFRRLQNLEFEIGSCWPTRRSSRWTSVSKMKSDATKAYIIETQRRRPSSLGPSFVGV